MQEPSPKSTGLGRLSAAARMLLEPAAGTAARSGYDRLADFLTEVRQALAMDVAFVARFADGQRIFKVVSASADRPTAVVVGASDPLIETYCKLVVDGLLPQVVTDTAAVPLAAAMPVTARLDIKSYVSVPVVLRDGEVFGTLCCFSHEPRQDLGSAEVDALQAVATVIASSIEQDQALRHRLM